MGVVGNLATFTQFNVADSIPDAAKNPGGLAAAGASLGMAMGMAAPLAKALSGHAQGGTPEMPPPIPGAPTYFVAVEGKQTGPFDTQALASQASAGRLTPQTLVWTQGMAQ